MKIIVSALSRKTVSFVFFASLLSAANAESVTPPQVRVACVGDSITQGSGTKVVPFNSYPAQLQRMLDPEKWLI